MGFGEHVDGAETTGVFGPVQAVGLARVHLAEVAVLGHFGEPQGRGDDAGRLDGPWQGARHQHVDGEVGVGGDGIVECRGLPAAEVGETETPERPGDHATESGERVAMTDEDQLHRGAIVRSSIQTGAAGGALEATSSTRSRAALVCSASRAQFAQQYMRSATSTP